MTTTTFFVCRNDAGQACGRASSHSVRSESSCRWRRFALIWCVFLSNDDFVFVSSRPFWRLFLIKQLLRSVINTIM
jgi:hypothetical protein